VTAMARAASVRLDPALDGRPSLHEHV